MGSTQIKILPFFLISQNRIYFRTKNGRRLLAKETMINMKFSVAIMTLVACLAYSAKIDNGADREKREESADKDLAGLKNLAKFEALNVKTRHARDQLRQDASCDDCDHCPKCKTLSRWFQLPLLQTLLWMVDCLLQTLRRLLLSG